MHNKIVDSKGTTDVASFVKTVKKKQKKNVHNKTPKLYTAVNENSYKQ